MLIKALITMQGVVAEQQAIFLKDDGSNANGMSKDFEQRDCHFLQSTMILFVFNHSKEKDSKKANKLILEARAKIGSHRY